MESNKIKNTVHIILILIYGSPLRVFYINVQSMSGLMSGTGESTV